MKGSERGGREEGFFVYIFWLDGTYLMFAFGIGIEGHFHSKS